jgi:hypothetical protein
MTIIDTADTAAARSHLLRLGDTANAVAAQLRALSGLPFDELSKNGALGLSLILDRLADDLDADPNARDATVQS